MELKIRFLKWSAGFPVVMLNQETASHIGVEIKDRVSIKTVSKKPKEVFTIVDTIEGLLKKNEIAVSSELKERLELKKRQRVEVNIASPPKSLTFIKEKLNDGALSEDKIKQIIKDVTSNLLSESEIALFVSAMYQKGMSFKETIFLIKAISDSGKKLKISGKFVVDKHSIGGVPGNRTTPIVVSICSAVGLKMPKSSSRAITTSAGTADVIETISPVEFSMKEVKKIISKTNACLIWGGGTLGVVPADSKIISVERILRIDPEAQLLASIMAKKIAMGSKYILIDIPYGKTAKVSRKKAVELKRKFERIGKFFRKKIKVVLTNGSQPIGEGVGPALELTDVLNILNPKKQGPKDLEKKSLFLAGEILEMTGKAKKGKGIQMAEDILNSGKAFEQFKKIIRAQGGNINKIREAKFHKDILSKKRMKISEIDNKKINSLARILGSPSDKSAGLRIYVSLGDRTSKKNVLMTIYSDSKQRMKEALKFINEEHPIK